jgi:hypothetical protein
MPEDNTTIYLDACEPYERRVESQKISGVLEGLLGLPKLSLSHTGTGGYSKANIFLSL